MISHLNLIVSCTGRGLSVIFASLLPSWFRPESGEKSITSRKSLPTRYLDGFRGLVAILVFIRHFSLPWQEHLDYGYGYDGHYDIMRLPIIRLLYAGPLVPVFFIVSGYVLANKSFKLARTQQYESLVLALASSAFRRAIRLFLPPLISTFSVMLMANLGFFSFPYSDIPGRVPVHPEAADCLGSQLFDWSQFATDELVNPWRWDIPRLVYGPHLWTIPISFKGSMVVFLITLITLRTKVHVQLIILSGTMLYTLFCGRWDMAPFLAGMILCHLDQSRVSHDSEEPEMVATPSSSLALLNRNFNFILLLTGLYIGSFPRHNKGDDCVWGYQSMCQVTPNYRYWHSVGAFAIMWAVSREGVLQGLLESNVAQYFGNISFSMYLVHEPLLHIFGFFTVPFARQITGTASLLQAQLGFGLGMVVSAFVLIWVAEIFRNVVERPCGRLAAWVERICFASYTI